MMGTTVVMLVKPHAPVTIVTATRSEGSNRVTLQVCNDAPDRVRLYEVRMWARLGTNWVLGGVVWLDDTNCTARDFNIEVDFPPLPRPWRASLIYVPAFSPMKLLRTQLKLAWNTKSLREGFMEGRDSGWEEERPAYSPEIP